MKGVLQPEPLDDAEASAEPLGGRHLSDHALGMRMQIVLLLQVIIAGKRGADDTEALLNAAESVFAPDKVSKADESTFTIA